MRASGARQHKQTTNRKVLVLICDGTGYMSTTNVGPTLTKASCRANTIASVLDSTGFVIRVLFHWSRQCVILEPNVNHLGHVSSTAHMANRQMTMVVHEFTTVKEQHDRHTNIWIHRSTR